MVAVCSVGDPGFDPWVGKIPWRRKWQPTPVLLPGKSHGQAMGLHGGAMGSLKVGHDWVASLSFFLQNFVHKALCSINTRDMVLSLGQEDPLEEEMTTHSIILAWKIQWTEEPGRLQSMGSQRVQHNWATDTHIHTHYYSVALGLWNLCGPRGFWPPICCDNW